jgi:hypothetical protein
MSCNVVSRHFLPAKAKETTRENRSINLSQQPAAFVGNDVVKAALN